MTERPGLAIMCAIMLSMLIVAVVAVVAVCLVLVWGASFFIELIAGSL